MIDGFNHKVTSSEKRGMIVLSGLILIIVGMVCLQESGLLYNPVEVTEAHPDTIIIEKSGKKAESKRHKTERKRTKKNKQSDKRTAKQRSPFDETISVSNEQK